MYLKIEDVTPYCTHIWNFEGSSDELIAVLIIYKKLGFTEVHLGDQRISVEKEIKREDNETQ